ncbi:DUF3572 domain-containing protein [Kordiimonas gwangyangensis]|uniref:DUF3572 domain-containing protein n=1 Tax=Kordiimonas gwangyangensis TaxID=288022 RepID=UPI00035CB8EC|nr:DUF3572 domain-containing protein [Kordiimonas gwangyangensis]
MTSDFAQALALRAAAFIFSEDALRDRYIALSGTGVDDIRARIEDSEFLASLLEFLMAHEPDLLAFAAYADEKPETIAKAWRTLGGGAGQEW